MKTLSITLIELPATVDGKLNGRLSSDVYALVKLPSRAIDLLAAICKKNGFEDVVAINPSFNKIAGQFTNEQLERITTSDVVGISTITRTASQSYELADIMKARNPGTTIIMGGPHASAEPEEALLHADVVVANEGDATFIALLNQLPPLGWKAFHPKGGSWLSDVEGIVFKDDNGRIVRTPKRPFLTNEELDALPFPVYTKEVLKGITHTTINTSRGCPFACDYCAVIENFGGKYRFLSVERTVELIKDTLTQTRKKIFFGDDNFTAIPKRTKQIMEEILRQGIKMPTWGAQVRVEAAKDIELLKLMKRANCERVCVGFESASEKTLEAINKHATLEENTLAIRRFHEAKLSIHGMFIAGTDTDTCETIRQTVEYAKKNRIDTFQLTSIVPLPGTKMTKRLELEHRVLSHEWHRYDGHHILVRPKNMTTMALQSALDEALLSFYSVSEALKHLFCGNEHWFNFLVRFWGRKLVKKANRDSSYYRKALASLDVWCSNVSREYESWMKKAEALANEAKSNAGKRYDTACERTKLEFERAMRAISERRDALDDYFAPYKQRILAELEKMMLKRLEELALPIPA